MASPTLSSLTTTMSQLRKEDSKEYWERRYFQIWSRLAASNQKVTELQAQLSQAKARELRLVMFHHYDHLQPSLPCQLMQEAELTHLRPQVAATYLPPPPEPQFVVRAHHIHCPPYWYPGRGFIHVRYSGSLPSLPIKTTNDSRIRPMRPPAREPPRKKKVFKFFKIFVQDG